MVARLFGIGVSLGLVLPACASTPAEGTAAPRPAAEQPRGPTDADRAAASLVARIELATQAWRQSCPQPNEYGLCVEITPPPPADSASLGCQPPVLGTIVVHPRDATRAQAALAELRESMAMAGCDSQVSCSREVLDVQPDDPEQARALARALASARLARADAELEHYFTLRRPDAPDQFAPYYDAMMERAQTLINDFTLVKQYRAADRTSVLLAALRISWALLHLSDQLLATPFEAAEGAPEARDSHCRAMQHKAQHPRRYAHDSAMYCRVYAQESGSTALAQTCGELVDKLASTQGRPSTP